MIPVLAFLLLAAAAPEGAAAEAPPPAPANMPVSEVIEAHVKPAAPRHQLRILAQDPRMEAYDQFRGHYESERFEEALPYARRVVELSETDPERDHELPIAYNNLGATQYQLADYPAAADSYSESLELLEATQGISSRRLVIPLAGLGTVYAALNEHAIAAGLFDRALAVSRRADGLFNLAQLPLVAQAADSRYALKDFAGVEAQYMYALKIVEQNYGYGDERTLPALLQLASFYESVREFIAARTMYLRARDAAFKESSGFSPLAIKALVGIARSHRLQYTMDPDTLESRQAARDEMTGELTGKAYRESRASPLAADRSGLKAAQAALELLRATPDPPKALLAETLIELGDWHQTSSRQVLSNPYYEEAATILEAQYAADPLAGNPLMAPRMVFYRPPMSASPRPNSVSEKYIIRKTVFSLVVSEAGEPQNVTVDSTTMNHNQLSQSMRALSRAIYSPRFANGKAIATDGVTYTADWYEDYNLAEEPTPEATAKPAPTSDAGT